MSFGPSLLLEMRFAWIDPVFIDLPGPIDVRWYGLVYLFGSLAACGILTRIARKGDLRLSVRLVGELLPTLVLAIILGGRLGYLVFYDLQDTLVHPLEALRVWEGGMSFHGGLIGVIGAAVWFTRRHGVRFLNVADALALATPFGLLAGRVANFINGELYGRVASPDVPWRRRARAGDATAQGWARSGRDGLFAALFPMGYGTARFFVELYRQPDAQFRTVDNPVGTVFGPLTMGQVLSTAMILAGALLLVLARWYSTAEDERHSTPG